MTWLNREEPGRRLASPGRPRGAPRPRRLSLLIRTTTRSRTPLFPLSLSLSIRLLVAEQRPNVNLNPKQKHFATFYLFLACLLLLLFFFERRTTGSCNGPKQAHHWFFSIILLGHLLIMLVSNICLLRRCVRKPKISTMVYRPGIYNGTEPAVPNQNFCLFGLLVRSLARFGKTLVLGSGSIIA